LTAREIAIAGFGLATSAAIFIAQGPYSSPWSYFIAFSPLGAVLVLIATYRMAKRGKTYYLALRHAKESYDLITSTDIKSTFRVRITNTRGDLHYERYFLVKLVKNGFEIRRTRKDMVSSEAFISNFPPTAKVISSVPRGISLKPVEIAFEKPVRGGRKHFDHFWKYEISPPLSKKGDFVEYGYSALIPECEPKAFSDEGAFFFFHHEALPLDIKYTLIAPEGYVINIIDNWLEDSDGRRIELSGADRPVVEQSGQMLTWQPYYRKRASFICRYKLTLASVNWVKSPASASSRLSEES
jgi:hypothetical protein